MEQTVSFALIKNDLRKQSIDTLKDMTNLKCLYSQQLPKMPRQYFIMLLFDTYHESLIVKKNNRIVAGITFRGFKDKLFYEIAFLAVNFQSQCAGLGSLLLNRLKKVCQQRSIFDLLTFADDNATGFFEKNGFTSKINLSSKDYKKYIKEYVGGKCMHCRIDPQTDYEEFRKNLNFTKTQIFIKAKQLTVCQTEYSFEKSSNILKSKANQGLSDEELIGFIPGIRQAGYKKEEYKIQGKKLNIDFLNYCQKFIELAYQKGSFLNQNQEKEIISKSEKFQLKGISQNKLKSQPQRQTSNEKSTHQFDDPQSQQTQASFPIKKEFKPKLISKFYMILRHMQLRLLHGKIKYKDQFIDEFSDKLKEILGPQKDQKEFFNKIKILKYEFMRNHFTAELKDKKI